MTHEKLINALREAANRSEDLSNILSADWERTKDRGANEACFAAARYAYRARDIAVRLMMGPAIRTANIPF